MTADGSLLVVIRACRFPPPTAELLQQAVLAAADAVESALAVRGGEFWLALVPVLVRLRPRPPPPSPPPLASPLQWTYHGSRGRSQGTARRRRG